MALKKPYRRPGSERVVTKEMKAAKSQRAREAFPTASNREQLLRLRESKAAGLSDKDRLELAQARARQAGVLPPTGITPQGQFIQDPAQEKLIETTLREAEAKKELGKRGLFEEEPPERTSLDIPAEPEAGFLQEIPIIGPGIVNIGNQIIDILDPKIIKFGKTEAESHALLMQDPMTRKEAMKRQIQEKTIAEGLSVGERFGALIESVPVISSLVNKFGSGLIEDPKGNVDTILKEIGSERERASVLAEKLATGKIDPLVGYDELQNMEDNVVRLEQRIKILASTSSILRADPDEVNRIEEAILRCRERIYMAKLAAGQGATIEASEASWFYTLQELEGAPPKIRVEEIKGG